MDTNPPDLLQGVDQWGGNRRVHLPQLSVANLVWAQFFNSQFTSIDKDPNQILTNFPALQLCQVGHVLHAVLGGQSRRPPQGKAIFDPLPGSPYSVVESWLGSCLQCKQDQDPQ